MRLSSILAASLIARVVCADPMPSRNEAAALRARAEAAVVRGDDRQALHDLEQAYLSWPSPATMMDIAEVHVRLGEHDLAIAALRVIIDAKADDPDAQDLVAHARLRLATLTHRAAVAGESPPQIAPIEDETRAPIVAPIDDYTPPPAAGVSLTVPVQPPSVKKKKIDRVTLAFGIVAGVSAAVLLFAPVIYVTTHTAP